MASCAKVEWWSKANWGRGDIEMAELKVKVIWAEFGPPPSAVVPAAARFPSIYISKTT
jgi:hypothetical protein